MPERRPGDYPHLSAFSANVLEFLDDPRPFLYLKIAIVSDRKKIIGLAQRNPLPYILVDPEETRALNEAYLSPDFRELLVAYSRRIGRPAMERPWNR
jgi:hypothetical protein